jgi:hypothetical protein
MWKWDTAMKRWILMRSILPMLVLIAPSHLLFASGNPKHCHGYACYATGYNDGYNDAKNGFSPAYTWEHCRKFYTTISSKLLLEISVYQPSLG